MAEFIYRSTLYGPQVFSAPDEGGPVQKDGKTLSSYGGYVTHPSSAPSVLTADKNSLEGAARRWWNLRLKHLDSYGRQANGVRP